ncbi:ABC transporter ATP-binding protein [Mesoterricola silvestris]|uniref:Peptide ABC transporter ATP-binding protein n=1 Tax=Mesoterricola silvestris TaxID=2927979 RepID=A0AA48KD83_9BACT|nr:ABC transporter ATP-binding protein [Mesoterricola silvestris]BDU74243.1 peptide ABC transporter ATP-binding protein [Mesoterricola silvestris]
MSAHLEARDLTIALRGGNLLVDRLSFDLAPGRTLGLVGESGSGKSLTALALLGLLSEERFEVAGHLRILGEEPRDWRRLRGKVIAMVFQEPRLALNPRMAVGRQIAEVLELHRGLPRGEAARGAAHWLDRVGIAAARAGDVPATFSGGMLQRICIAMALAAGPRILVADEPTTALDTTVQAQVLDLVANLQRELGLAVLLVTHDLPLAAQRCDDLLVIYAGRPMESGPTARVLGHPRHRYTEALIACARFPREAGAPLAAIPGQVPLVTPQAIPPCVFADRCAAARDDCLSRPYTWFPEGHACFHPPGEAP